MKGGEARTCESLLERHVRVDRVERRDKAKLLLDLLFVLFVRRAALHVVLFTLCGLAKPLALCAMSSTFVKQERGLAHLFREHLDVR